MHIRSTVLVINYYRLISTKFLAAQYTVTMILSFKQCWPQTLVSEPYSVCHYQQSEPPQTACRVINPLASIFYFLLLWGTKRMCKGTDTSQEMRISAVTAPFLHYQDVLTQKTTRGISNQITPIPEQPSHEGDRTNSWSMILCSPYYDKEKTSANKTQLKNSSNLEPWEQPSHPSHFYFTFEISWRIWNPFVGTSQKNSFCNRGLCSTKKIMWTDMRLEVEVSKLDEISTSQNRTVYLLDCPN